MNRAIAGLTFALIASVSPALAQRVQAPSNTAVVCAYNALPPTLTSTWFGYAQCDALGNLRTALSSGGSSAQISLDGALSVNTPAAPQFADTFSAALDTTTNWTNTSSTGTAAVSAGNLVINSSTTASAWGSVASQQTFAPVGVSSQAWGTLASFTVLAQANSVRVFGVFNAPGSPTTAAPVTDGYVYRLDGTGALFAEIWASGVAVSSTNVTASCLPAAATPAIFAIVYRANLVQFTCGAAIPVNLAPIIGINPVNQILKVGALSVGGSTPPAASAVINLSAFALATISPGSIKSQTQPATINDPYLVVGQSPVMPQTYPTLYSAQTTATTNSAVGTTGVTTATLAAVAAKFTYLCGFTITSDATAALAGTATVTGPVGGTMSFIQNVGTATAAGTLTQAFQPCIQSSAVNTAIVVNSIAAGVGGNTAVVAWGYQQ